MGWRNKTGVGHFYTTGGKNGLEGVRMGWAIFTPWVKNGLSFSYPGVRMRGGGGGGGGVILGYYIHWVTMSYQEARCNTCRKHFLETQLWSTFQILCMLCVKN